MKSPDIQLQPVENGPRNQVLSKAELIKKTGGEKMIVLKYQAKPTLALGREEIVLSSFATAKVKESKVQAGTELKFTTTCCDNNFTRPDGSCPPTACTR
jgi:hypothetical protein